MVIIRDPFLGTTNDSEGKEEADDYTDDVSDERGKEVLNLRVMYYKLCADVGHLYAPTRPNHSEEYPRRHQYDENANQQEHIAGASVKLGPFFLVRN